MGLAWQILTPRKGLSWDSKPGLRLSQCPLSNSLSCQLPSRFGVLSRSRAFRGNSPQGRVFTSDDLHLPSSERAERAEKRIPFQ